MKFHRTMVVLLQSKSFVNKTPLTVAPSVRRMQCIMWFSSGRRFEHFAFVPLCLMDIHWLCQHISAAASVGVGLGGVGCGVRQQCDSTIRLWAMRSVRVVAAFCAILLARNNARHLKSLLLVLDLVFACFHLTTFISTADDEWVRSIRENVRGRLHQTPNGKVQTSFSSSYWRFLGGFSRSNRLVLFDTHESCIIF